MSQNALLPQQMGPAAANQQLQLFEPGSIAMIPQPGLASGQLTLSGSFTLTDSGSYNKKRCQESFHGIFTIQRGS